VISCPRDFTVAFDAVAAIAESSARRASFLGMCFTMFFCDVGGCGCLPPTVLGANFARPPPPLVLGMRAIPWPVPCDSAVVRLPAIGFRPWGCSRLVCVARTARFMTSGLSGVVNIVGSVVLAVGFPWRLKMLAVFLAVGMLLLSLR
jgi:hypothetical protein